MKILVPGLLLVLFTSASPVSLVQDPSQSAAPGTYQIIQDVKMREIFTAEAMDSLRIVFESIRHESNDIIHPITPFTKALIPSRQSIGSPNFIPLDEYQYIEE